jgi:hypothetical protein
MEGRIYLRELSLNSYLRPFVSAPNGRVPPYFTVAEILLKHFLNKFAMC